MPKRIIPVASGKGGVGKTTFAINFALALSRHAPTVLVDLDTGTSSVRSTVAAPVGRDLYHVLRRGAALGDCVTSLPAVLDPEGEFRAFGFVAAPRHFIAELANPAAELRRRLAQEINGLAAEYVVLDLRAGLDEHVLDFLPFTNSGVLVFTPHHPTANLAASELVKAILFRTLRTLFAPGSALYGQTGMAGGEEIVAELLASAEDVYDPAVPNLDALAREVGELFGRAAAAALVDEVLADFRVHYVLNHFDGVAESASRVLRSFLANLSDNVSTRPALTQLGWVVADERIHRGNCEGRPILLDRQVRRRVATQLADPVMAEFEALASSYLGLARRPRVSASPHPTKPAPAEDLLGGELASLKAMYGDRSGDSPRENFAYLAFRALNLIRPPRAPTEFGQTALAQPEQVQRWYLRRLAGSFAT